jgi:hypothetical protein
MQWAFFYSSKENAKGILAFLFITAFSKKI